MSKKNRNDFQKAIDQNIYDNTNKEILASMIRSVFDDTKDSFFNLIDDRLKTLLYEGNTTLEQYLNSIAGAVPLFGSVSGINVGESPRNYSNVTGIISSASSIVGNGEDSVIKLELNRGISNRKIIPVISYVPGTDGNIHNDVCYPVYTRLNSQRIDVSIRKVAIVTQNINLEIIAL